MTADFVRLVLKKNRLDIYLTEFNYVNMALVGRTPGNCLPSPPPPSFPPSSIIVMIIIVSRGLIQLSRAK